MSAAILKQPDPSRPFIMKADTSKTGARWSHRGMERNLSFTQVLSSQKKLSPTECNNIISNREVLAVKLALEEAQHLLVISTDHNNSLKYLKTQLTTSQVGPCPPPQGSQSPSLSTQDPKIQKQTPSHTYSQPPPNKNRAHLATNLFFGACQTSRLEEIVITPGWRTPSQSKQLRYLCAHKEQTHHLGIDLACHWSSRYSQNPPTYTGQALVALQHPKGSSLHYTTCAQSKVPPVNSFHSPNHNTHALT